MYVLKQLDLLHGIV